MAEAERRAVELGVPSLTLMENAGRAVADEAAKMVAPGARIVVLCGPGNNGGDGFVAARLLAERGFDVRVACLVPVGQLKGDAAAMAGRWAGDIAPYSPEAVFGAVLVVDAIYGAGLNRRIEGSAADVIAAANANAKHILAVDVPSGLDGNSGQVRGQTVIDADRTVIFFRCKPGHLLLPGRTLCGEVVVSDIGIPDGILFPLSPFLRGEGWGEGRPSAPTRVAAPHPGPLPAHVQGAGRGDAGIAIQFFVNAPGLWRDAYLWPRLDGHKYDRGHAVVVSGSGETSGAARLAARGALRVGAGLVTLVGGPAATAINAMHTNAIMVRKVEGAVGLAEFLSDTRRNAVLIGPGAGVGAETAADVLTALASNAAVVLDADALTSFAERDAALPAKTGFGFVARSDAAGPSPAALFAAIKARASSVVLTPHEGEFKRLFGDAGPLGWSKLQRARHAAELSGAVIILKGPDTVIASPDGFAAINDNAPPTLATAGSGDVLAGFVTGLLAQGMPAFEAACAAVWLHGECANVFGPGLIAEDLPEVLPKVLSQLYTQPRL
ncbi:MAG: NAD(P)H-hydrate dehydratase [Hyphomicrobium sp.]